MNASSSRNGKQSEKAGSVGRRSVISKVLVLMGLLGHLLFSIATWSATTNQWLDLLLLSDDNSSNDLADSIIRLASNVTLSTETTVEAREAALRRHLPLYAKQPTVFSADNEFQDLRAPRFSDPIPLKDLVETSPDPQDCTTNHKKIQMSLFHSIILEESITHPPQRHIPKIIHMTSKSRCITTKVLTNILEWTFEGYSVYFHDDAAVDRLLAKYFPAFPHLQTVQECSISGAAKADIWRYLVLWEYGGIYTDIDNAPGKEFKNGTIIEDSDEAWFVVERIGVLSQYFMASAPHHPIMFIAMTQCLSRLTSMVDEIGTQYVPYISGPGVTKAAMMLFMKDLGERFQKVTAGKYEGIDGRTVTVAGSRKNSNAWIKRESITNKKADYKAMDMKHFSSAKNTKLKDSCYEYMYKQVMKRLGEGDEESK